MPRQNNEHNTITFNQLRTKAMRSITFYRIIAKCIAVFRASYRQNIYYIGEMPRSAEFYEILHPGFKYRRAPFTF